MIKINMVLENNCKINILYLYAELMGYQIPILELYVKKYNAQVHVVHWDQKKLTPYTPPKLDNVHYYNRSEYSKNELKVLTEKVKPDMVYVSGWQDKDYLSIARMLRKDGIPVVVGFDDQWKDTLKQNIASFFAPYVLKSYFSHAWVAGPYQYEYAKRMGFNNKQIIFHLLSGNTSIFANGAKYLTNKKSNYPKTFLYVGNFRFIKGTDILAEAFKLYREKYHGNWDLICIGNGELKSILNNIPGVNVLNFMDQLKLAQFTEKAGAFVLPSRVDQWGVVVHEFASAGLPLILSENVGARAAFLINNYNGLMYKENSPENLAKAMCDISSKPASELIQWGNNSINLSKTINPEIAAASFISCLSSR